MSRGGEAGPGPRRRGPARPAHRVNVRFASPTLTPDRPPPRPLRDGGGRRKRKAADRSDRRKRIIENSAEAAGRLPRLSRGGVTRSASITETDVIVPTGDDFFEIIRGPSFTVPLEGGKQVELTVPAQARRQILARLQVAWWSSPAPPPPRPRVAPAPAVAPSRRRPETSRLRPARPRPRKSAPTSRASAASARGVEPPQRQPCRHGDREGGRTCLTPSCGRPRPGGNGRSARALLPRGPLHRNERLAAAPLAIIRPRPWLERARARLAALVAIGTGGASGAPAFEVSARPARRADPAVLIARG